MKVIAFTNSSLLLKTIADLTINATLAGIVVPEDLNYDLLETIDWAEKNQIPLLKISKNDLLPDASLSKWMINLDVTAALVMTFPFKIPEHILNIPEKGVFNVHFSMLPSYKGSAPLFWQLKNGEKQTGLSIHKMTPVLDAGPLVFSQAIPFMPGENYGIAKGRLTTLLAQSMAQIISGINANTNVNPSDEYPESFFKRPEQADLTIDWNNQTAIEIENLVNAANPLYQGAITYISGQLVKILEVSMVTGTFDPGIVLPGTVFHADLNQGPMVLTMDKQLLLLNIIETPFGIFSGRKICAMGLKPGDRLST